MAGFANVTLADLQTQLAQRYDGAPFWTPDQARRAINEGLRVWNVLTGTWRTRFTAVTLPNDPYVALSGGVVKAIRVKRNGVTLDPGSIDGFDMGLPNWEGRPGVPRYWAPVSLTLIALAPPDAIGGAQILVDAISPAPILINPGDYLNLGSEEISTLLGYALHVLSQSQGLAALTATQPLYLAFMRGAAIRNDVLATSSFYRELLGLDRLRFDRPLHPAPGGSTTSAAGSVPAAQGGS
jgi:hypothetical protein